MQLVAYGAQDIYLTGNPQITFFKIVYRRHTNFAMESIQQPFDGKIDYDKHLSCTVARNGDLIHRVYLEVNFDNLLSEDGTEDSNVLDSNIIPADCIEEIVKNNAFSLIDRLELEIGGQLIDRQYGDWMNIWCELTHSASKSEQLRKLVSLSNSDTNRVHIPFQFSFCRNPGLSIPLIALQYHEVKFNIKMAKFEDIWGSGTNKDDVGKIKNGCVWIDYIYLDTEERRRFAQTSHEYLIEQLQSNRGNCTKSKMKVKLNFNHPVKELFWVHDSSDCAGFDYRDETKNGLLSLNGHDRFAKRVGDYFKNVQRYQHHTGSRKISSRSRDEMSPIYMYSFGLNPEEHQPSGTCNFSRIDNAVLELDCELTAGKSTVTNIYGVNYNVLRIMSGMGGLAYSN